MDNFSAILGWVTLGEAWTFGTSWYNTQLLSPIKQMACLLADCYWQISQQPGQVKSNVTGFIDGWAPLLNVWRAAGSGKGLGLGNVRHAISVRDVVSDTVHQFAPTYHDYVLYSNTAQGAKGPKKTVSGCPPALLGGAPFTTSSYAHNTWSKQRDGSSCSQEQL